MDTKALFALADADDAEALIAALPDKAVRNENGESLFLYAVFRGRTKCVEALKKRGGLNLHEAALAGDVGRVATLLGEAPWAVDLLSPDGWTALHLAAFFGNDAVVVTLLERGADARVMGRAFEQNMALHAGAAGGRIGREAYAKLIAATGVDARQKQGYTALMIAASNGFAVGVEALLAAGANRGIALPDGKTAADIAADRGHSELEKRLR
ncbi:MAG TPA: ankyrin repeat domain-containing protein [Rhizomicrobium sp.]|nr:ankyrin repeat domain-containing protein [Rhizomicrobium sp.]